MILACSNISKSFSEETVLKQVSFHIEDYEKAAKLRDEIRSLKK